MMLEEEKFICPRMRFRCFKGTIDSEWVILMRQDEQAQNSDSKTHVEN